MQETTIKKRAAIIARCSSEANVCSQVLSLKQYAHGNYLVEEEDVYGDHISGSSTISERPQLTRLMQNIDQGKKEYAAVLIQDPTRLGKLPEQSQEIINWFTRRNILVHFQEQQPVHR
jgi:DNA invertase Pin-like site-specific DNA recombinase